MNSILGQITDAFYYADNAHVLMYTAELYMAILTVVLVAFYIIARRSSRKHIMYNLVCVEVTLNERLDGRKSGDPAAMSYGKYWIGMQDSPNAEIYQMNPKRSFFGKAFAPDYPVSVFLARFHDAMRAGGMEEDPGVVLLKELLQDAGYCARMGRLYRRGGKKGLTIRGNRSYRKDRTNSNSVRVVADIPEQAGKRFAQSTGGCVAERLCITMETV